jgi:serine/threonine protein kinase
MEQLTSKISEFNLSVKTSNGLAEVQGNLEELVSDYSIYLDKRAVAFSYENSHLVIGNIPESNCWIIHISVVRPQMSDLLDQVLDTLIGLQTPFVLPANIDQQSIILDGRSGLMNVGKVISVFVQDDTIAHEVAATLIKLTAEFKGPEVPAAVHLGSCVYVSYGSFQISHDLHNNKYYSPIFGYDADRALLDRLNSMDIKWPFRVSLKKKKKSRLINSRYLPVHCLKNDAKGNVFKCIKINKFYNMQWCVIKRGNKHQSFDDAGRDMKDRLLWQHNTHKQLEEKIPLPKVIDYFEVNGDTYLALEYIDGVSLSERVNELCQGTIWKAQPVEIKRQIINYLIQAINILEACHQNGFIHRDINPGNFLVTKEGLVKIIDIELCYNFIADEPSPPFTLGTPGYISPQQLNLALPAIEDDIYGLGALVIKTLTGLSPSKLSTDTPESLVNVLRYFIGYHPIENIICGCLSHDSSLRPDLKSIEQTFKLYDALLLKGSSEKLSLYVNNNLPEKINSTIQKAINSLGSDLMLGSNKEWVSRSESNDLLANEFINYSWYPYFHSGTAGTLFTLSLAEQLGYNTHAPADIIGTNLNYLLKQTCNYNDLPAGLWHGSYGVAIAISALMKSGMLENNISYINGIYQLLSKPTNDLSIANGLAGQGLCILCCLSLPQFPSLHQQLSNIVSAIIKEQQKDGAWLLKKDEMQTKGVNVTGLAYGIAGITYFLLAYYSRYEYSEVKTAIIKSLNWLTGQRKLTNGNRLWPLNPKIQIFDPWLENGYTGIALTFIKAYEVLQNQYYKEIAVSALLTHPKYISCNYFSIGNGLSGLGEVYLEAFKIFKENEWKERADHIVDYLSHTYKANSENTIYWLEGNCTRPTADFMEGNSGIIYFLMRRINYDKINSSFLY